MASKEHTLMASGAPYILRVTKDGSIKRCLPRMS